MGVAFHVPFHSAFADPELVWVLHVANGKRMRHRWGTFSRLGRDTRHRKALLKNLATALIKHERIVTTLAKAKQLRRVGDKMITYGKRDTESSRKKAWKWMRHPSLVNKLFGTLQERYADRPGGYTRVLRAPNRKGDNAPMAVVELVGNSYPPLQPACNSKRRQSQNQKLATQSSTKITVPPEGTPV